MRPRNGSRYAKKPHKTVLRFENRESSTSSGAGIVGKLHTRA